MKIVITSEMRSHLRGCLDEYICNTFPLLDDWFDYERFLKSGRSYCPFCEYDSFLVNDRGKRRPEYRDHTYKCFYNYDYGGGCVLSDGGDLFNLVPITERWLGTSINECDFSEILYHAALRVRLIDKERLLKESGGSQSVKLDKWHYDKPTLIQYT